jgi:hypothetical protein
MSFRLLYSVLHFDIFIWQLKNTSRIVPRVATRSGSLFRGIRRTSLHISRILRELESSAEWSRVSQTHES